MPITDIASYVITADEFLAHWVDVNADRVANTLPVLLLQGSFAIADFQTERDTLQAAITGLEGLQNASDLAASTRDSSKAAIADKLGQFRSAVRLHLATTNYASTTPTQPPLSIAESKFLRPFDDLSDLWQRINGDATISGFTPPLLLRGGYARAAFVTELAGVRTSYQAVRGAENDLTIARRQRDSLLDPVKERMLQYRSAIELEYGPEHAFFQSLPDISPAPGSTPDPVTANGQWDAIALDAQITWNQSTNLNLLNYKIRMSPGPTYDSGTATVIATLPPPDGEHRTLQGLENSGYTASYKVFVILTTGNESGSNTVTISRP